MWFWCNSLMAGWWWIFPVMAVLCFLVMFLFMRRCFAGRFSCCGNTSIPGAAADTDRGGPKAEDDGRIRGAANKLTEPVAGG
jgi:hypothetical protein